jgi:hypothetical protein
MYSSVFKGTWQRKIDHNQCFPAIYCSSREVVQINMARLSLASRLPVARLESWFVSWLGTLGESLLYECTASHKPFLYRKRPLQQNGDMRKGDIV